MIAKGFRGRGTTSCNGTLHACKEVYEPMNVE
jgi:hypothetical protein